MRNAAVTANVPLEPLREMMSALIRETQPPAAATQAASTTLNNAHMQVDNAQGERLLAEQQSIVTDNQNVERDRAIAASVTERLAQTFATPFQTVLSALSGVQSSMASAAAAQPAVQHVHHQPVTQNFHNDNRQVALVDARQALQQAVDARQVNIVDASQTYMQDNSDNRQVNIVDASQNFMQDNRQVTQAVVDSRQVNITENNINVAMTAFTINHREEILQFMQDNSVNYDVAVRILYNIHQTEQAGEGASGSGGGGGGGGGGPGGGRPPKAPPKAITQGQLALTQGTTNPGPPPPKNPAPKSKPKSISPLLPTGPPPKYGPASTSASSALTPYAKPKGQGEGRPKSQGAKAKGSAKAKPKGKAPAIALPNIMDESDVP